MKGRGRRRGEREQFERHLAGLPLRTRQYLVLAMTIAEEEEISMAAVARRLGVSRSYLSRLLSGERTVVGEDAIRKACTALALPRDYFDDPAYETSHYREAQEEAPPIDDLVMVVLNASGAALEHQAAEVLEALEEGEDLERWLRSLVSTARATLFLDTHEKVVELLARRAALAELQAPARAYALAMKHLGTVLAAADLRVRVPRASV